MKNKAIIQEIISDFYTRTFPDYTHRHIDLACPKSKIRTLIGPRRAGKTYTFFQIIQDLLSQKNVEITQILYINLEDERLLPLEVSDLTLILETYFEMFPGYKNRHIYLFFDEIQNVPDWEHFIRRVHESENVSINITGSSSQLLSQELASALRGRTLSYEIFPFSYTEFLDHVNIPRKKTDSKIRAQKVNLFEKYLISGGFPEILDESEDIRIKILQEYYNMILYKDLIERFEIRNHQLMKYLLKFLFINHSTSFSINKFYLDTKSQGYQSSKDTFYQYMSYLEDAFCFSFVPIFTESIRKQNVNYKKIYAVDHGFVTSMVASTTYNTGRLLENIVYNFLRRFHHKANIMYYKTKSDFEIDFIVTDRGAIQLICQVSESIVHPKTREREIRALNEVMDTLAIKKAVLITRNESELIQTDNKAIDVLPFWRWAIEYEDKMNCQR